MGEESTDVYWWLAETSQYGYACKLIDGPHDNISGVEQAAYLHNALGFSNGRQFCAVRIEQFAVKPTPHDVDQDALSACHEMMAAIKYKDGQTDERV